MKLSFHIKNILLLIGYGIFITCTIAIYALIFFFYFPIYFLYDEIKNIIKNKNG